MPTELLRHMTQADLEEVMVMINALNETAGRAAFEQKALEQGAATSDWGAVVATDDAVGGRYCEDCRVGEINEGDGFDGVDAYTGDSAAARATWEATEGLTTAARQFPSGSRWGDRAEGLSSMDDAIRMSAPPPALF